MRSYVAVLLFCVLLSGCGGRPSAVEFRDHCDAMTAEQATAGSRAELVEKIGIGEPDSTRRTEDGEIELWVWQLDGGSVTVGVKQEDGRYRAMIGKKAD